MSDMIIVTNDTGEIMLKIGVNLSKNKKRASYKKVWFARVAVYEYSD